MKACLAITFSIFVHGSAAKAKSRFGPQNCVTVSRSDAGSCVITTDCEGIDLSQTEFAFDCGGQDGAVRHSFGMGGFEGNEEFDSEVECDRCDGPVSDSVAAPVKSLTKKSTPKISKYSKAEVPVPSSAIVKAKQTSRVQAQAEAVQGTQAQAKARIWPFTSSKPEVARYGPNGCVSTWKSEEGHCLMQTDCKNISIAKYNFGLVCVDKTGSPVRHLFGKDSFEQQETFDTLIKCDKCLGLEDIPNAVALNGEVETISKDIGNLRDMMKNITINVKMLNDEVFKNDAPSPAAASPAPAQPVSLVRQEVQTQAVQVEGTKTQNLRHTKRHRQQQEDDDDDDSDDRRKSDDDDEDDEDED